MEIRHIQPEERSVILEKKSKIVIQPENTLNISDKHDGVMVRYLAHSVRIWEV